MTRSSQRPSRSIQPRQPLVRGPSLADAAISALNAVVQLQTVIMSLGVVFPLYSLLAGHPWPITVVIALSTWLAISLMFALPFFIPVIRATLRARRGPSS